MHSPYFDNYWARRNTGPVKIHNLDPVFKLLGLSMEKLWPDERIKGKRILEIGPGAGSGSLWLSSEGAHVSSLDISRVSAGILADRAASGNGVESGSLSPVVGEAEFSPFRDAGFDGIHMQTVWMHLDKEKTLAECRRLLRPGGRLLVVEPMKYNPLVAAFRSFFSVGRFSSPVYLSTGDIERMCEGFSRVSVTFKSLFTPPLLLIAAGAVDNSLGSMARKLVRFEDRLLSRVKQARWFSWFVVLELIK